MPPKWAVRGPSQQLRIVKGGYTTRWLQAKKTWNNAHRYASSAFIPKHDKSNSLPFCVTNLELARSAHNLDETHPSPPLGCFEHSVKCNLHLGSVCSCPHCQMSEVTRKRIRKNRRSQAHTSSHCSRRRTGTARTYDGHTHTHTHTLLRPAKPKAHRSKDFPSPPRQRQPLLSCLPIQKKDEENDKTPRKGSNPVFSLQDQWFLFPPESNNT